jgi:hypothetical protein
VAWGDLSYEEKFLGLKHWDSTGTTVTGTAVLRQALVSGPGVRP